MNEKIPNLRIPKPKQEVKRIDEREASVKKSQEAYRQMMRQTKNPETSKEKWEYRFRFSQKMWWDKMADLTQSERMVYLTYCSCADFKTGEAIISARKTGPKFQMTPHTFCYARNSLVKKGWLLKTRKAPNCYFYKILKIKIA